MIHITFSISPFSVKPVTLDAVVRGHVLIIIYNFIVCSREG